MKKTIITLVMLCCVESHLFAQESVDTSSTALDLITATSESVQIENDTLRGWNLNWVGGLNGSQAAYSNWSQGGVNTVSVTASTVFSLFYRNDHFAYQFITNLKYGRADIEGEGTRKTDDRISVGNKFSYIFDDERFNAFGSITFNTQFDKGFDYDEEPALLISDFFAPAYFSQVAGVGFSPASYFSAEAGIALKETIVNNDSLSTRYGLSPGDNFRFEPGYSVILNFKKNVFKNVSLISTVETFSNFERSIDRTDVYFSNELIGKINNLMNMSFQFVLIYDEDFSTEVQLKQVLSVGISFNIL